MSGWSGKIYKSILRVMLAARRRLFGRPTPKRASYIMVAGVMSFTIAQPSYLMAIFNLLNPPKVAPLYSEFVRATEPQPMGAFSSVSLDAPQMGVDEKFTKEEQNVNRQRVHELTDMRTAYTSTYLNNDGTKTMEYSTIQQNFKENGVWKRINNKLESFTDATGRTAFRADAGNAGASLRSLHGGISLIGGDDSISMKPVGTSDVRPEKLNDYTIIYRDAWPNVDLRYEVRGEMIKEYTVLKNKAAQTTFDYAVTGGQVINDPQTRGALMVEGVDGYHFSPLTLEVNERGIISEERVAQTPTKTGLRVSLDNEWFKSQPDSAFPMVIDPSWISKDSETTYKMYKSNGYYCPPTSCYANIGTLDDGGWKHWRTYIKFPYTDLDNKYIISANMNGTWQSGVGGTTTAAKTIYLGEASCSTAFNCFGSQAGSQTGVTTAFSIGFKTRLQSLINANDFSTWWSFKGGEGSSTSLKAYYMIRASVTYDTPTPMAASSTATPVSGAVITHTQPSLKVNAVNDVDSADTEQYYFRVTTGSNAESGTVINSGWISANQWTVPEHILQDGTTYYWHVYTRGNTSTPDTDPDWVKSFRIDLRTGKDSTQAYDTVGPVDVDLATGNLTTSVQSHSISALGGDIGLNLDYNSTALSRPGLIGEYYEHVGLGGAVMLTRNDQDINFDWGSGSPDPIITSNDFSVHWSGYITPDVTGDYKFGCVGDDACRLWVNDVEQVYAFGEDYATFNTHLEAGVPMKYEINMGENTGNAKVIAKLKDGSGVKSLIPASWFSTAPQTIAQKYGMTGRYYNNPAGDYTYPTNLSDPDRLMMVRQDSKMNFVWGTGSPSPGLPSDKFLVKWKGYLTVPTSGNYKIGVKADDRVRTYLNGSGTADIDSWTSTTGGNLWGSTVSLSGGQAIPITIDYAEQTGSASFQLLIQTPDNVQQEMPTTWIAPEANVLPTGWNMSVGLSGARFEKISIQQEAAILSDSSGQTYEFAYKNGVYAPPAGEESTLIANSDNTYTLQDVDGSTYLFDAEGKLTSYVGPQDDRQPASLKYEYSEDPVHLTKIIDSVDNTRYGELFYSGDSECVTGTGFDATPDGMLCAFITTDGDETYFQYKNGALARVETPGDAYEDFQYDSTYGRLVSYRDELANDAIAYSVRADDEEALTEIGYDELGRVSSVTAPAPTASASRMEHIFEYLVGATEMHITGASEPNGFMQRVEYDSKFRTVKTIDNAGLEVTTEWDSDKDLVLSTTDSLGLKSTTIYNDDDLPTDEYGAAPSSWFDTNRTPLSQYVDDVPHAETKYDEGINGLAASYMSVTQRDSSVLGNDKQLMQGEQIKSTDQRFRLVYQTDGNVVLYGPSGAMWNNGKAGVPSTRLKMQSDGNLVLYDGSTAKWSSGTNGNGSSKLVVNNDGALQVVSNANGVVWSQGGGYSVDAPGKTSLIGTPQLNATGLGTDPTKLSNTWTSSPLPSSSDYWGVRMTGKMYLPTTGNWNFRIASDNGVRMIIDDTLVIDDWADDSVAKSHPAYNYNNTAINAPHKVAIDLYHIPGSSNNTSNATFALYMTPPGGSETDAVAQYFKPNYQLVTSEKAYDSVLSDTETQTEYSDPAYGLISKSTIDPSGLDIENNAAYETPGSGYLRQTSRTMPGGTDYIYTYYGATESIDNPCTVESDAVSQAGRIKMITEPDPDDTGTQTSRSTETIYNSSGDIVATRTNNDSWTCFTYDDRGRQTESVIPTINGRPGRTVQTVHVVSGNPLVEQTIDSIAGTTEVTYDLLGRVTSAEDVWGNSYSMTFDDYGNVTEKVTPLGTEEFTYNTLYQLTDYELDSTILATITYDSYGRVDTIVYPEAHDGVGDPLELTQVKRDNMERVTGATYVTSDGETLDETVVLSQLGKVVGSTQTYDTQTLEADYTYDSVGRLTSALVGETQFDYGYGALDSTTCSSNSDNNMSAHLNSNRTSYTVTNDTTSTVVVNDKLCYNYADQLTKSTDINIGEPTYDDHGNTTSFEGNGTDMTFEYDADDYNTAIEQGTKRTEYVRTAEGGILRKKEFDSSTLTESYRYVAGGSILQTCNLSDDDDCTTVDRYVSLPGKVTLTLSPSNPDTDKQTVYSLHNDHGDTVLTLTGEGKTATGLDTLLGYGPFGEMLLAGTLGTTTEDPLNAIDSTMGWAADPTRKQDGRYTTTFVQMGARVYVPSLGRFLQVDPVEGGAENAYAYVTDPVNYSDYSGQFVWFVPLVMVAVRVITTVVAVVKVVPRVIKAAKSVPKVVKAVTNFVKNVFKSTKNKRTSTVNKSSKTTKSSKNQKSTTQKKQSNSKNVHGNSLKSQKPTWGYKLYEKESSTFLKNGITSNKVAEARYTKSFMSDKFMVKQQFPNRLDAYRWEYSQNLLGRGPLNKNWH